MSRHRRPSLGVAFGYVPGEQPADGEAWVKLNTNESPLPCSAAVAPAVAAAAASLERYPNPLGEPLRSALAEHHRVDPAWIAVGNGADALLECCFRAWCEPGSSAQVTTPTYSLLDALAAVHAVRLERQPLDPAGRPAGERRRSAALRVLVNPNSPTGTWLAPADVEAVAGDDDGVVVIDEAYGDFAPASMIDLLPRHPSWVVVRTFSKSYALAGLRVGYAVAAPELIDDLLAVGDSYALDRCAIAGATAALADTAHHRGLVAGVVAERARLTSALGELGWSLTASHGNFVCGTPPGGAASVFEHLRACRVLVRHFPSVADGVLRVTVGTASQNDALLRALQ